MQFHLRTLLAASFPVLLIAACNGVSTPTGPTEEVNETGAAVSGLSISSDSTVDECLYGSLRWEKREGETNLLLGGATFDACRIADRYGQSLPTPWTCIRVLDNASPDADPDDGELLLLNLAIGTYRVTEYSAPPGYILDATSQEAVLSEACPDATLPCAFVNEPVQIVPPENPEGCTLGYWKNHLDSWEGYDPGDNFFTVFAIDLGDEQGLPRSLTLQQALNTGGGHFRKLARQGVAALLNAAHDDVDYYYTEQQVKDFVEDAFESGVSEPLGTQLDDYNNEGCPLN